MSKRRCWPQVGEKVKILKTKRSSGTIVSIDGDNAAYQIYSVKFDTLTHYETVKVHASSFKKSSSQIYQWTIQPESLIK